MKVVLKSLLFALTLVKGNNNNNQSFYHYFFNFKKFHFLFRSFYEISFDVWCLPTETVAELMSAIQTHTRMRPSQQILLFGYVNLRREQTLDLVLNAAGDSAQLSLAVSQRKVSSSSTSSSSKSKRLSIGPESIKVDRFFFFFLNCFVPL